MQGIASQGDGVRADPMPGELAVEPRRRQARGKGFGSLAEQAGRERGSFRDVKSPSCSRLAGPPWPYASDHSKTLFWRRPF